ncbi:MAG: alanine--glyoxylate aminotransferase family protein [Flavobacteriales bacterium]|jgi:alanine-glyoxylate transaminase/serine-glyoxylate transaminase/serine-pyruvate transaminase|nr:alanine--glyoxylate aminotransferase family protein [Flavobacteriales bacterium]
MSERKLLMIPGPIEFDPTVLERMSEPTLSHVAPAFIESFGHALEMMREVWLAPSGQPFIIAGSGTLAMDMAGANLIESGHNVLVVSTGYFGERYAELLKRYGANVTLIQSDIGDVVSLETVESELSRGNYKLMTFTHVDTSTGVLVDPKPMADLANKYNVLSILDGVCSVAGEEIRQDEWGIDVVVTASQKAVGVPPGLALLVASEKAMNAWKNRKTPVGNYYCDWNNWLPIMQAYEARNPSYFGTPPVNLIQALETSLELILAEGMDNRFARHKKMADKFRDSMRALDLGFIPKNETIMANTLTAPYYPEDVNGGEFLGGVSEAGVIVAGGLLPELKTKYFRVGHMGIVSVGHIERTESAVRSALGVLQ